MTDDTANFLHGRIVALELLVRALYDLEASRRGSSAADVAKSFDLMMASVQHANRQIGDNEDATWAFAVQALEETKQALMARRRAAGAK